MSHPTWDILICSIVHRTAMLAVLLEGLKRQLVPGVGVRVFRDNLGTDVGEKRRRLVESSKADYVSFVDDDDLVHQDYVALITEALRGWPDYVGFKVKYTQEGNARMPVYHSLTHSHWFDTDDGLYRDISHLNPIRRDLAALGEWSGGNKEDNRWAASLRKLECVKTEVWIDEELYWYRHRQHDTFLNSSTRAPMAEWPPPPDFGFVTWLT